MMIEHILQNPHANCSIDTGDVELQPPTVLVRRALSTFNVYINNFLITYATGC
jgi:hypothetical protein